MKRFYILLVVVTCLLQLRAVEPIKKKPLAVSQSVKSEMAKGSSVNPNLALGNQYMKEYEFDKASLAYAKAMEKSAPTEKIYVEALRAQEKAKKARALLDAVQDVAIIDSIVVPKKDFFKYYNLSSSAGSIFSIEKDFGKSRVPSTGYVTQRDDRMIVSDTVKGGNYDLFFSNKLLDGWSDRESLSKVLNTAANENYPFLLSDGLTLYFSSDGDNSIGGYDIFVSRPDDDGNDYYPPENIGMPFNSPFNDYLMAVDEDTHIGLFASDRNQSPDSLIIYRFAPNDAHPLVKAADLAEKIAFASLKRHHRFSSVVKASPMTRMDSLIYMPMPIPIAKKDTEKQMNFLVRDGLTYHSVEQFKSAEAKALYLKGIDFEEQYSQRQVLLDQKRKQYAVETGKVVKAQLVADIKSLEYYFAHTSSANKYFKQCRNWEIKALR